MFCKYCGTEIQDSWKMCPKCGTKLRESSSGNISDGQTSKAKEINDAGKDCNKGKTRQEIKEELKAERFSEKGSVVLWYGCGAISKDLADILKPGEEVESFYHAYRSSLLGFIKSFRMFRNYIVCTNERLVYNEAGNMVFSIVPFIKKKIEIPYTEILEVQSDKRLGIYSGTIRIETKAKTYTFAVINKKDADNLKKYLVNIK